MDGLSGYFHFSCIFLTSDLPQPRSLTTKCLETRHYRIAVANADLIHTVDLPRASLVSPPMIKMYVLALPAVIPVSNYTSRTLGRAGFRSAGSGCHQSGISGGTRRKWEGDIVLNAIGIIVSWLNLRCWSFLTVPQADNHRFTSSSCPSEYTDLDCSIPFLDYSQANTGEKV